MLLIPTPIRSLGRIIAALLVALVLSAGFTALAAAAPARADDTDGISGAPSTETEADGRSRFTYQAAPGQQLTDNYLVRNTGTTPQTMKVFATDAYNTDDGSYGLLDTDAPAVDAGSWVSFADGAKSLEIPLDPGATQVVPFAVDVPGDAAPGDHAAGIVTSLVTTDASQSLSVDRRLGTRVNLRVAGELDPAAAITDVSTAYTPSWNPFAAGILTVSYALENPGNTRITGVETLAVAGPLGLFDADAAPVQLREIIPGSVVEVTRELPVMSLGWVGGTLTVTPEGVGLGTGSVAPVSVEVGTLALPWSLYALLVLTAAIVAAGLIVMRVRRARVRDAAAAAP